MLVEQIQAKLMPALLGTSLLGAHNGSNQLEQHHQGDDDGHAEVDSKRPKASTGGGSVVAADDGQSSSVSGDDRWDFLLCLIDMGLGGKGRGNYHPEAHFKTDSPLNCVLEWGEDQKMKLIHSKP